VGIFSTGLESHLLPIDAGTSASLVASMSTASVGTFETTFSFQFSDEDLLGEALHTLTMTLTGAVVDEVATGDFDGDGDIDGRDFLAWQRGESPNPFSSGDLELWQAEYGSGSLVAAAMVPEPNTAWLLALALIRLLAPCRVRDSVRAAKNC
jgi:hypothetical protein